MTRSTLGRRWQARSVLMAAGFAALLALPVLAQTERVDLDAIGKIKDEGLQRSQVMEVMSYLTDVYGPRLTGSPNIKAAGDYATKKLTEWGLSNAKLEPWGPFGRGWSNEGFTLQAVSPQVFPIIAYPKAWTPGTDGPVTADAVIAVLNTDKDFDQFKGKLKGKFVLVSPLRDVPPHSTAESHRYTTDELNDLTMQPEPRLPMGVGPNQLAPQVNFREMQELNQRRMKFLLDEGVAAVLDSGRGGSGGTVYVQSGGGRDAKDPPVPPQVTLAVEHYGRLYRMLEKNLPVKLELNAKNVFYDNDLNSFNVVAEIPGTDKAGEIVMLGGHFDSWHTGTGATDNAAGSAVMMEAVRILKASGLKMRRTVRIGLWTGEEEGLLGSRAYVKEHFADRETMALKPEHGKLSAYYNVDNGTGAIRGVYQQGNEMVAPIFKQWMEPFANLGMTHLTIRNTGGTDHLAFDAVGLPGFQFIQDAVEYETRTHHSNMDVYERIQPKDMMYNAVIVAAFVYETANRDALMPRKPLPKPGPALGPGGAPPARPTTTATSSAAR
jgi:hypothetical protein